MAKKQQTPPFQQPSGLSKRWKWSMLAFVAIGLLGANGALPTTTDHAEGWKPWEFLHNPAYTAGEQVALVANVLIAIAGLVYAGMLVKQVYATDTGTDRMQEITRAVREGANAYLRRQFTAIGPLIIVITAVLILTKWPWAVPSEIIARGQTAVNNWLDTEYQIAIGRGIAFLIGSIFSATVGFVGMRLATAGNLRVAVAAKRSFGEALQIGYRTGTITGMLTDGLGLLGGSMIFLYFGEKAYEALLGFGFGGTLLALFMRVGGGIYTKAADVGADLVGKVEAGIPEDDPRNAATIADNVGDNVGDCAGMAADIFESYEVTIVAAMILGLATFGHKGVIFPLLVRAIGVIGSIISTYSVKTGERGDVASAMKAVEKGFILGSIISVVGFVLLGLFYFRFDDTYKVGATLIKDRIPAWASLWGITGTAGGVLDIRPSLTCFIGIVLAIALNKCTEYWTGTEYEPVKSLAKSCRTGHATNIIQGIAVGYESTVWAVIIIAVAIFGSVMIYSGTNPLFIAYGVAMCGIGLLTLTGNTISMDVFGPVADNANGIGEMGYNKDTNNQDLQPGDPGYMNPEDYRRARQILADLDAVGNTTKAITKGIAIGSAVVAAVSLFASFIAVMATGSEEGVNKLTKSQFLAGAAELSVADPKVFIGLLIGGAVPFLFSSMTIRAVGRAAYLIVQECRVQFKDPDIWANRKKPDYGRVVDICTSTAQKELVGPGLLAMFTPILVGFTMGPYALGGFLAGMILSGQLLAVFMANSGGAWDNAKKTIEDQPRTTLTGKGSETHKASVTGDTVGDPLKDTAGPAINPLIKVMNMVSLLILPLVITFNISSVPEARKVPNPAQVQAGINPEEAKLVDEPVERPSNATLVGVAVVLVALLAIGWAWWQSKRESPEMRQMDEEFARQVAEAGAATQEHHPAGAH
jgi:K(+)-stimulated pyrophosphate-energized sodium pump